MHKHRRQAFWQIWLPIGIAAVAFIAVTVIAIITTRPGEASAEHWANISAIWLILPTLFTSIIWLTVLGGLIFLMAKAIQGLPKLGIKVQNLADKMYQISQTISNKVASPVLKVNGWRAGWREFVNQIRNLLHMI